MISNNKNKGFTLIELLVVIAILATLAVAVTLIINPAELMKQGRDSTRLSDMNNLNKALSLYQTDQAGSANFGSSSTVYVSLPDDNSNCSSYSLPSLPSGWSYNCVSSDNLRNVDGTGWIPADFTSVSFQTPLSTLPIDPINEASSGRYYTYVAGSWQIEALMESQEQQNEIGYIHTMKSTDSLTVPGAVRSRACGDNGTFSDSRNDKTYQLTLIGEGDDQQCWFAENLDYDDGCSNVSWVTGSDVGWCDYHSSDTSNENGLLYQWSTAMNDSTTEGAQGLCPSGWHIPTDDEYKTLEKNLGMSQSNADLESWRGNEEGVKLKQGGTGDPGWSSESCGNSTCNLSGWAGTGGGARSQSSGSFFAWRSSGHFWSSSVFGGSGWRRSLHSSRTDILRDPDPKAYAYSVRCIKD